MSTEYFLMSKHEYMIREKKTTNSHNLVFKLILIAGIACCGKMSTGEHSLCLTSRTVSPDEQMLIKVLVVEFLVVTSIRTTADVNRQFN